MADTPRISKTHKRQKEFESALKALAHDSFYRQCRALLPQDSITEDEISAGKYVTGNLSKIIFRLFLFKTRGIFIFDVSMYIEVNMIAPRRTKE